MAPRALTDNEIQILGLIAKGYLFKQVADEIGVTEQTIHNWARVVYNKLGALNKVNAVAIAKDRGLI